MVLGANDLPFQLDHFPDLEESYWKNVEQERKSIVEALDWVFDHVNDPRYGSLLASSMLFFVPTAISGMVSPYAIRLLVTQLNVTGKSAGSVYFVSTFGSATGTILTSFYLVLLLEVNQILFAMMATSTGLGLLPLLFSKDRQ